MRAALLVFALLAPCGTRGARPRSDRVVVVYAEATVDFTPMCPDGRCEWFAVDHDTPCAALPTADIVVVSGHGEAHGGGAYLGLTPRALARVVRCFMPRAVVLDVCHGYSEVLLRALAEGVEGAWVVGSVKALPPRGLTYGARFFERGGVEGRLGAVQAPPGVTLQRWRPTVEALDTALASAEGWGGGALDARLESVLPNLARVPVGGGREVLIEVPPSRFRGLHR